MSVLAEAVIAAFDSNAQIVWNTESTSVAVAIFQSSTYTVRTTFSRTGDNEWRVAFDVAGGRQSATENVHASIRIFSGVFQAVREFLEIRQPEKLVFASKEESLGRLYETYLAREDTTLAQMGYRMIAPVKATPLVEFVIVKTSPSAWRE